MIRIRSNDFPIFNQTLVMKLTNEQSEVFAAIMQWIKTDKSPVAILVGSAGTGKTTLLKSIVESLEGVKKTYVLLAPTGRAARILGEGVRIFV